MYAVNSAVLSGNFWMRSTHLLSHAAQDIQVAPFSTCKESNQGHIKEKFLYFAHEKSPEEGVFPPGSVFQSASAASLRELAVDGMPGGGKQII
jgi:hypothetical protein